MRTIVSFCVQKSLLSSCSEHSQVYTRFSHNFERTWVVTFIYEVEQHNWRVYSNCKSIHCNFGILRLIKSGLTIGKRPEDVAHEGWNPSTTLFFLVILFYVLLSLIIMQVNHQLMKFWINKGFHMCFANSQRWS
jgi:hypothetical protein